MENYSYDREGCLDQSSDSDRETMMVKEYNDRKAFTGIVLVGIIISGLIFFVGVIYALTIVVCNSFDLISKLFN